MNIDMTFSSAERAHERQEREDYSEMQDDDIEEQIISCYMQDAHDGADDDWVVSDSNRTNAAMLKIAKILESGFEASAKVVTALSVIHAVQAAAAADHLSAMKHNGMI